ncbi:MAG: hypothetical protein FJ040_11230 [Chloroflexi bacterium]|nr:hypothetical protein [Chloroflexota bacterium]
MHDQAIQLDASFDNHAHYTISYWLRTRDSYVVSGEPIVIVDDGTTQRVITAPCTGHIVDIYVEAGVPVMPRAVLGMVRPNLIMPTIDGGTSTVLTSIFFILIALITISLIGGLSSSSKNPAPVVLHTPTTQPPAADDTSLIDSLVENLTIPDIVPPTTNPDVARTDDPSITTTELTVTPLPTATDQENTSVDTTEGQPLPTVVATEVPSNQSTSVEPTTLAEDEARTSAANDDIAPPMIPTPTASSASTMTTPSPTVLMTATTDQTVSPTPSPANSNNTNLPTSTATPVPTVNDAEQDALLTNEEINWEFVVGIDRIVNLTKEVEANLPSGTISQSTYDNVVAYANDEVRRIIEELELVIAEYRDYAELNEVNRQWFDVFTTLQVDCLSIYNTLQQSVTTKQSVPDLTQKYNGCYAGLEYIN